MNEVQFLQLNGCGPLIPIYNHIIRNNYVVYVFFSYFPRFCCETLSGAHTLDKLKMSQSI